jgi:hypothetical protein
MEKDPEMDSVDGTKDAPIAIREFAPRLADCLPETHHLLMKANLYVHPAVTRIVLHGSRGLAGGFRPDSDLDLSLIVGSGAPSGGTPPGDLLKAVLETTLNHWQDHRVEVDLAAVYDQRECGLVCFHRSAFDQDLCPTGGADCFGLSKIQKGFTGFVPDAGIQVNQMYPCLTIWRRETHTRSAG